MKKLDVIAYLFLLIGSLNLGVMGVFGINLIDLLLESQVLDRLVYTVVGLSAVYVVVYQKGLKTRWSKN